MAEIHQLEKDVNFFDQLSTGSDPAEALRFAKDAKIKADKLDYLIHQTFEQNRSGRELLAFWKESLMMQPTAEPEMDNIEIGIREGQKRFLRAIILTIKKVEKGE